MNEESQYNNHMAHAMTSHMTQTTLGKFLKQISIASEPSTGIDNQTRNSTDANISILIYVLAPYWRLVQNGIIELTSVPFTA